MREITQPMRLFDFVFGPLVLPLQDLDAREGELFLTTAQWQQQCRHAGFSKVAWLPQDGSPNAGMSEHIILATLPGHCQHSNRRDRSANGRDADHLVSKWLG